MRYILLFITVILFGANSKLCKTCHPTIYSEYKESMHFKSTLKRDAIHNALWQKHPLKQKGEYKCAKCHNPKIEGKLDNGVDCLSCHKIKDIKEHTIANTNIYEKKPRLFYSKDITRRDKKITYHKTNSFFGLFSSTVGSPYHDIDYRNKNYYTGRVCMGCHSHLKNSASLALCQIPNKGAQSEKQNCITCHMPKVLGSATTIKITKTHAYHGFLGAFNKPQMLAKYIDLNIKKDANGFSILIKNNAPHPLFTQPLRVAKLKVIVLDKQKPIFTKEVKFFKLFGKDNKPTIPPLANMVIKDNMIKENETKVVKFNHKLSDNQKVIAILGYYKITPKSAKKLDIKSKNLTSFVELKRVEF